MASYMHIMQLFTADFFSLQLRLPKTAQNGRRIKRDPIKIRIGNVSQDISVL
jgi:hypothetical protein